MILSKPPFAALSPVFYDIEASPLVGYPIEIGWAQVMPSLTIGSESYMIHHFGWDLSRGWKKTSERIHGISRTEIRQFGRSPYHVALRMNGELNGRQLFADSEFDQH